MRSDALLVFMREAGSPAVVSVAGVVESRKRGAQRRRGACEVEVDGFEEWDRARRAAAVRGVAFRADDFR